MKLRRISSLWTPINKFVVPPLGILFIVRLYWEEPWSDFQATDSLAKYMFMVVPFLALAFNVWWGWSAKWVAIDEAGGRLYVSNYLREISIPFSHIDNVTESWWSEPRRIKIYLREPSEFGDKIVFFGTYRLGGILSGPHPIADELTRLAVKATMSEQR